MSASLVGSEMCIRDRSWCGALGGGVCRVVRSVRPRATAAGFYSGPFFPCLLYTSDAADDM
eukprot:12047105-Alexandrium_andersonii.AAC.1